MHKSVFMILRYSGLPFLFRNILQRNMITIIMFHDISKETAERTFTFLMNNYNIIDLNEYIKAREDSNIKIPKKALIITFDDGHIRNYDMLPILKKYDLPITIFLCSSIVNTKRHYWFKYRHKSIIKSELKQKTNKERLSILSNLGFKQDKEFLGPQALQKEQIEEMKSYVNLQSHTMFHPLLPKSTYDEAKLEIFNSKKNLEIDFDLNINAIAYPNGDYSDRDVELVKNAGYKCGLTVDFGFNSMKTDMYRLKRLSLNDSNNIHEVIVKTSGVWAFFKTRNGKKQTYGYTNSINN